jgi:hypothetical protein
VILVYPFSLRDIDLALKNAKWINELGGCKGHECLCIYDTRCDPGVVEQIGAELLKGFDKVYRLIADAKDGWPEGANYLFARSATWLQNKLQYPYLFWMEPDAITLTPGWLDKLEAEYKRAGKPFMGDRVEVEDIPLHMSGVGIYQNPIYMLAGEAYRAHDLPAGHGGQRPDRSQSALHEPDRTCVEAPASRISLNSTRRSPRKRSCSIPQRMVP